MKKLFIACATLFKGCLIISFQLGLFYTITVQAQSYSGVLTHTNGYFSMFPYNSSYDDGSYAKIFYDGNNKRIQFWNSNSGTAYTHINVGNVSAQGHLLTTNPNNLGASVYLGWQFDVARIRVGGNGNGASNGLDIQGPGDTSLFRIAGNGNITSKGNLNSTGYVASANPANTGATVSLSWLNNLARIRIGGSGAGASSGLDIQTTGDRSLMRILHNGNVGIGTTNPGAYKLAVNGKILAKEIKVETGWADYVFQEDYDLPTLEEVEQHIKEKGHLPNIPSAQEVAENGIQLGEMNKLLLEKIEELTLYVIQLKKENQAQNQLIQQLQNQD